MLMDLGRWWSQAHFPEPPRESQQLFSETQGQISPSGPIKPCHYSQYELIGEQEVLFPSPTVVLPFPVIVSSE